MKGLELDNLTFSIQGHTLFKDLSAQFKLGQIIALAGANGCGKSTLLRIAAGLHPPSQGKVLFNNQLVTDRVQASQIGYVPHLPCLYNHLTVAENILWINRLQQTTDPKALTLSWLSQHRFIELKDKLFGQLSEGQKKRINLLACTMHHPKLLLLDEPCSLLDPIQRHQLWALLKSWQQADRLILFSTHHVSEIHEICDEIVFLHQGQFHFEKQSATLKVPCL